MNDIKRDFNIVWYVLCWNEMPILPFMIDYWKQIARKVIVYDNESTDGTLEFLSTFDWIEVRTYESNNKFNDKILIDIKNNCWKEQKDNNVDFVIVSDVDEILWDNNLYAIFKSIKDKNYGVIKPIGYDVVSLTFPVHDTKTLLHKQTQNCFRSSNYDKCILFNPDLVQEINYKPGCHECNPILVNDKIKCGIITDLYLFHFKYLSLEYLTIRRLSIKNRMSEINKKNNWSFHYLKNKDEISNEFNQKWNLAKDLTIDSLLNKNDIKEYNDELKKY